MMAAFTTEEERALMCRLRAQGLSLREIGAAVGRDHKTVRLVTTAGGNAAHLEDVRRMRAAISHNRFRTRAERLRLLRLDDATLLAVRDWCRAQEHGIDAGAVSRAVPGVSYDQAKTWLRIFWWVSRPVSLRTRRG